MSKSIATRWKVVVNGVDLSVYADDVSTNSEKDQVDVSGFGGAKEYLPGTQDDTLEVEFFFGQGSNEPHRVMYPLYSGGSQFPVYVLADSTAGTSSTNQLFGGSASIYTYPVKASLNDPAKYTVTFKPAPLSSFTWGTTAP